MAHGDEDPRLDERDVSMLDALFTRSPVGLHLLDTDLRVVRINTATPSMQGVDMDHMIGRSFRTAYDIVVDDDLEQAIAEVLETGVAVRQRVVRARFKADPSREGHFEVSALRLESPEGKVLGVAVTSVDVTERERARGRARVLDAVRRTVGRTLDSAVSCEELVDVMVPAFADVAIVEVVDAVIRGDEPPLAPLPPGTPLLRAAFRSTATGRHSSHPVGDVHRLPGPTPFTRCLSDLRARVVSLRPDAPWLAFDPPRAEAILSSGVTSLLAAPLTLRDTVIGLLTLYRAADSRPFDEGDRRLAVELAAHTTLCIDNARRFAREHTVAATVQRHLLPRSPESQASLETAYLSVTGADPGAWYDTIALSSARTALVVGSVSGRGLNAAATMGQLRTVVRSLSTFDLSPDELLARLYDTAAHLAAERAALPPGDPMRREPLTADCVYAVHDPLTGTCTMAGAGRLAPVVVEPDGSVSIPDTPSGPALGSEEDSPFAAGEFAVPDGSVLVFTSDPLLTSYLAESSRPLRHSSDYRDRPLQDLCDDIVYALPAGTGAGDAAVIVARVRSFPPEQVASWEFESDPATVALARSNTRRQLALWPIDQETAFNTELIVSELVTNAIRYGSPPIEVRLVSDRTLTCEVRDSGSAAPHLRHARTVDEGGRGLFIASQLAQAWGTRYSAEGKTIWTEQSFPSPKRRG